MSIEDDVINDLNLCPTIYHAVSFFKEKLLGLDYSELKDDLEWSIPPPSNFFIIYKNKNIIAFNNKENSKGTFLIGNMKPNLFHIDKNSKISTFDYNFCRVLSSCSKCYHWTGRSVRVAGSVTIEDDESKPTNIINIYPKKLVGVFPSKQEIEFVQHSSDLEHKKLYTIDFFLGLSRDCDPFINEFPGPIMKMIADELEISSKSIQNPDLFLVDSNLSKLIESSADKIISGQNVSQFCPPLLAFNSFLYSTKSKDNFNSFILFDENDSTDSSFNEFLIKLFQKIGINNDSLVLNIIPMQTEKVENRIYFDTTNKKIEDTITNEIKDQKSKIQIELHPNLNPIVKLISSEIVKFGFPISNIESPRERASMNCLNSMKKIIDQITNTYVFQ